MAASQSEAARPPESFSPSTRHMAVLEGQRPLMGFADADAVDVRGWQNRLRPKVRDLIGLPRMPMPPVDLRVRTLWRREVDHGTIEKLVFTVEPGCEAVAFLCLPRDVKPPYVPVIALQGHSSGAHNSVGIQRDDPDRPLEVDGDRDFGLQCLKRGYAALCLEQRGFGERRELAQAGQEQNGCLSFSMHALMLGRTAIGERVYDVDCGVDLLARREDMDLTRLTVMGNSGGGTISAFAAATLPRVRFLMPSCYFCTFRDSVMSLHHCSCNFVPGLLRYAEMPEVLGLFAPRPVVVVAGQADPIFPIEAVREAYSRLQRIYRALGAEANLRLVVGEEGHRFYAEAGWSTLAPFLQVG